MLFSGSPCLPVSLTTSNWFVKQAYKVKQLLKCLNTPWTLDKLPVYHRANTEKQTTSKEQERNIKKSRGFQISEGSYLLNFSPFNSSVRLLTSSHTACLGLCWTGTRADISYISISNITTCKTFYGNQFKFHKMKSEKDLTVEAGLENKIVVTNKLRRQSIN